MPRLPVRALGSLAILLLSTSAIVAATSPVSPAGLRSGDTIMMVAPAGALDQTRIELAAGRLRELGFRVIVPEDLFRQRGYLAGTDQQRADEMMRAFLDPEVDAIFCGTGGYGVTRMLDLLDWDQIAKHPKVFVGFSDITAMHLALATKANLVTFHSPNPQWGLGSEDDLAPFSAKYFWRNLLAAQNQGAAGFTYDQPEEVGPLKVIAGGRAVGRLTGGNLSLVATLMGTPYEIQTDGRILFLEDVHEAPYRIDRMLSQLKLAGKLDRPAGVILGQYRDCSPDEGDSGLSLDQVFADYFSGAPYPVVSNFPAGHTTINATLPLGARAEIDADGPTIRVLENPVASE